MTKQAVSVTLDQENLLWLRGQAQASKAPSLSAALDGLIAKAREGGQVHEAAIRSVVGTVHIASGDPDLLAADAAVRALFPMPLVAEATAHYGRKRPPAKIPARRSRR